MLKLITHNFPLKLLAIVLSFVLWLYVVNGGYKIDFVDTTISIKVHNLEPNLTTKEDLGDIALQIRAPVNIWEGLDQDLFSAFIDAEGLAIGTHTQDIKVISSDSSVQIISKQPERVSFTLEEAVQKEMGVTVQTTGEVGEGYQIKESVLETDTVTISGSQSGIDVTTKVVAEISLNNNMADFEVNASLFAADEEGNKLDNVLVTPSTTTIKVVVEREANTKIVGIEPKTSGQPDSGFWIKEIKLDPSTVTVRGNDNVLTNLTVVPTNEIGVLGIKTETRVEFSLNVPPGVEVLNFTSGTMTIILDELDTTKSFTVAPVFETDINLSVTSVSPQVVTLVVSGKTSVLNSLTTNQISLKLDLVGKKSGTYTLPMAPNNVKITGDATVISVSPNSVRVTLSNQN